MKVNHNLLLLVAVAIAVFSLLVSCKKEEDKLMLDYPSLTDASHVVSTISGKELVDRINNGETFTVLMGFSACPWCQAVMPYYNQVAKELEIKKVYYLDIKDMRDNSQSPDRDYYLYLKNYCTDALDKEKDRINAPTIIVVKEGKLLSYHLDTVASHVKNEQGILPPLSDEQIAELKSILKNMLNEIA